MIKQYRLLHPITSRPETAVVTGFYMQAGRAVGLVLRFSDKRRRLTYQEIRRLMREVKK